MARQKLTVPRFGLVQDAKSKLWHVSYTDPETGFTRKRSTGTRDRTEAGRLMPAIVHDIAAAKPAKDANFMLGELLNAYECAKCHAGKNATFYALKPLRAFFHGFKPDQLNDAVWQAYRDQRVKQRSASAAKKSKATFVSDATAVKELNVMRGALTWGRRNGWKGLENVAVHVEDAPDYVVQEYLTYAEAERLLRACVEPHTALFVRIALATGARMSAILELTWDNVVWRFSDDQKSSLPRDVPLPGTNAMWAVNVRPHAAHDVDFDIELRETLRLDLGRGRGNKRRGTGVVSRGHWRLYEDLRTAYEARDPNCPYVVSYRGKKVGKINLEPAYKRAGLTNYKRRNHLLKHTCCSWLVQGGATFEAVAKLVGTRAETIRKHYGHLSPEHLETAARALAI